MTTELTVRLFAAAAAAAGATEVRSSADTLSALRAELVAEHPGLDAVLERCSFLVDGVSVKDDCHLGSASTVDVLPPFAGG